MGMESRQNSVFCTDLSTLLPARALRLALAKRIATLATKMTAVYIVACSRLRDSRVHKNTKSAKMKIKRKETEERTPPPFSCAIVFSRVLQFTRHLYNLRAWNRLSIEVHLKLNYAKRGWDYTVNTVFKRGYEFKCSNDTKNLSYLDKDQRRNHFLK